MQPLSVASLSQFVTFSLFLWAILSAYQQVAGYKRLRMMTNCFVYIFSIVYYLLYKPFVKLLYSIFLPLIVSIYIDMFLFFHERKKWSILLSRGWGWIWKNNSLNGYFERKTRPFLHLLFLYFCDPEKLHFHCQSLLLLLRRKPIFIPLFKTQTFERITVLMYIRFQL